MNNQLSFLSKKPEPSTGYCLFTDGAARNNPGPAGAGIFLMNDKKIIFQKGFFLGHKTNNQAEYLALIIGLIVLHQLVPSDKTIIIHSDSELLVKQMNGLYKVKNPELQQLFRAAYMLSKPLNLQFKHILRTSNKEADALANHGIETKNALPEEYRQVLDEYHINI